MRITGPITPTIAANTDNWNPANINLSDLILINSTGTWNITGLTALGKGRVLNIVVTAGTVILVNNSGSSLAANRFSIGSNLTLAAGYGCTLFYDVTNLVWRVLGRTA